MLYFIKTTDITIQRFKLFILYILNLKDILFTQFVFFNMPDVFFEANPVLAPIIHTHYALLAKVIIPAFVFIYWDKRYIKATEKERKTANIVINCLIFAFILINLLHAFNLILFASLT